MSRTRDPTGAEWTQAPAGDGGVVFRASGPWTLAGAGPLAERLEAVPIDLSAARLDVSALTTLDTVGAYLLVRFADRLKSGGVAMDIVGVQPRHRGLLDAVLAAGQAGPVPQPPRHPILDLLADTGRATAAAGQAAAGLIAFLGLFTVTLARIALRPARLRFGAMLFHIQQTGVNALPILGLLSFLIGVVLAFQGAAQLQRFGAELFVVDLLGVSILREIGILMTAIIVAGRSGSAFTAQIGTMKVNEEVDAIRTLGLDPMELLVVPRVLALMISLPLLGFFADLMGLLGGAVMCWSLLDISFLQFARQLHGAIGIEHALAGLVKAPVFAMAIALVGGYEGMNVERSAESVGHRTTRSVVQSIFLVIVLDAAFSILFQILEI